MLGAGEEFVRDVEARGFLDAGAAGDRGEEGSSSEEQRSIMSLVVLACFENRALRRGPLLGDIGFGVGWFSLVPFPLLDETGGRDDDTDAVVDEGGLRRTFLLMIAVDGSGELGGGGVREELLLADGVDSSGSSSSSGVLARWLWVGR